MMCALCVSLHTFEVTSTQRPTMHRAMPEEFLNAEEWVCAEQSSGAVLALEILSFLKKNIRNEHYKHCLISLVP